jgi:hypothetical protein
MADVDDMTMPLLDGISNLDHALRYPGKPGRGGATRDLVGSVGRRCGQLERPTDAGPHGPELVVDVPDERHRTAFRNVLIDKRRSAKRIRVGRG